jgi:hypothetical protein
MVRQDALKRMACLSLRFRKEVEEWSTLRCTCPRYTAGTGCRYHAPLSTGLGWAACQLEGDREPGSAPLTAASLTLRIAALNGRSL